MYEIRFGVSWVFIKILEWKIKIYSEDDVPLTLWKTQVVFLSHICFSLDTLDLGVDPRSINARCRVSFLSRIWEMVLFGEFLTYPSCATGFLEFRVQSHIGQVPETFLSLLIS